MPDEVSLLQFNDVSDRAVNVAWAPPRQVNGILTGYRVRYQIKDTPSTLKIVNLSSNVTSLMVTQLQVKLYGKYIIYKIYTH